MGESFPFQSLPTATFNNESSPCEAMMVPCNIQQAIAVIRRLTPSSAVGAAAKWFSPIHLVTKGTHESQNRR
jgi:hypothetical protein